MAFEIDDLAYAFECAGDFLDAEEWPEDDGGNQVAAYREAARRVRRMALYYRRKAHAQELQREAAAAAGLTQGRVVRA